MQTRFGFVAHDLYDRLDLSNKQPGDLLPIQCMPWPQETSPTFFFANTCELALPLTQTHIAFGFNDLGILLRLEFDEAKLIAGKETAKDVFSL